MREIICKIDSYSKSDLLLAVEIGADGFILAAGCIAEASALVRAKMWPEEDWAILRLDCKLDEEQVACRLQAAENIALARGWEVIPVENLLAHADSRVADSLAVEVGNLAEARLAMRILERGVSRLVVLPSALPELAAIVAEAKLKQGCFELQAARVNLTRQVGLGHRVCVDTVNLLRRGQGILVGNSSSFTFLVHAETEHNEYVSSRPFRVNAGALHAYTLLPEDRTAYLEELAPGREILLVDSGGYSRLGFVGRAKMEVRPLLYIEAEVKGAKGGIFLQNAETVCLVRPDGSPVSVVTLREGDEILCHLDAVGRHFGLRVAESIEE